MGTAASARAATKAIAPEPPVQRASAAPLATRREEAGEQRATVDVAGLPGAVPDAVDDAAAVEAIAAPEAAGAGEAAQEPGLAVPAPPALGTLEMMFERDDGTRVAKTFDAKPLGIDLSTRNMPPEISKVRLGGIADRSGVQAGWRLVEVNREDVAEKPLAAWRELLASAVAALPVVRDLPLQVFAHVDEGSVAFVCSQMSGEDVGRIGGLGPEDVGSALAGRIRESVPAPPSTQWKIVLPEGRCLENDELTLPLQELFDLGRVAKNPRAETIEQERLALAEEPGISEMVFELEDGTRVVAKPLSIEFRRRPPTGVGSEVRPSGPAEAVRSGGEQAEWKLVEVNKEDVTERPPASLRELLSSVAAAPPQAS